MTKPFTQHPEFMAASHAAGRGFRQAVSDMGFDSRDLYRVELTADRIVDEITKLLLRIYDAKQAAKSKAA